tara:strand:+ start:202 stop:312 length:111 start_codon:yes stop_codon:yes gene_type:complete
LDDLFATSMKKKKKINGIEIDLIISDKSPPMVPLRP